MNRKEFGKLIAALRKEHFDEDGNRLTQAKLAKRAQQRDPQTPLNEIIIGKIERGERAMLDEQTLLSLADTLELTMGERREFFLAATGLDNEQILRDRNERRGNIDLGHTNAGGYPVAGLAGGQLSGCNCRQRHSGETVRCHPN